MNLYLKILTRQMMSTSAFEKMLDSRKGVIRRYRNVEQSAEWKEYQELRQKVTSDEFQQKKTVLLNTRYSDTYEAQTMAALRRAAIRPDVLLYQSMLLDKKIAACVAFAKDPEKMARLQDKEQLKKNARLRLVKIAVHSKLMHDFLRRERGKDVQAYLQLKQTTSTDEFRTRNEFWQNPRRWFTTPECKTEERYEQLSNHPDIIFFLEQDPNEIAYMESFEEAFVDDFLWSDLSKSAWKPGFFYPSEDFQSVHSYVNEQQAYNHGKNVSTTDGVLRISTVKEKTTASAWDPQKGMVMHDFNYTSDVINNAQALGMEEGVVQVKARCRGLLNHGISLRGKKHLPILSIFNYSNYRLFCGLKASENDLLINRKIESLQPILFFIYTVVWDKNDIVWYVNNVEVYRTKNTLPKGEKLYLHMFSYGLQGKQMSEGSLEVDWVRAYVPKK